MRLRDYSPYFQPEKLGAMTAAYDGARVVYGLGRALYWACTALAVFWVGLWLVRTLQYVNNPNFEVRWDTLLSGDALAAVWLPALLVYGLGRFFRYVLSEE
jgi:hypothetical protein